MYTRLLPLLFLLVGLIVAFPLSAQRIGTLKARKYATGLATYKQGDFYAKVTYGRPVKRHDRDVIFGVRVPFRKLWRTGADDATEITFTQAVTADSGRLELPAGTYSLFTIPDTTSGQWTVILNRENGLWGRYQYSPKHDVGRFRVPFNRLKGHLETLTMWWEAPTAGRNTGADLIVGWETLAISIPFRRKEGE